ncbi:hypothetical protein Tco_0576426 [Tanacetum coccineum]
MYALEISPYEEDCDLSLEETINEVNTQATEEYELLMSECYPHISLNALSGIPTFNTMGMKASVAKHLLYLLLDTDTVAGGIKLVSHYMVYGFQWTIQGQQFKADVMLLPLGVKWFWEFDGCKKVCLRGTKQSELQWMNEKQLGKQVVDDPNTTSDPTLKSLLQEFEDVFAIPSGLPP